MFNSEVLLYYVLEQVKYDKNLSGQNTSLQVQQEKKNSYAQILTIKKCSSFRTPYCSDIKVLSPSKKNKQKNTQITVTDFSPGKATGPHYLA